MFDNCVGSIDHWILVGIACCVAFNTMCNVFVLCSWDEIKKQNTQKKDEEKDE